MLKKCIVGVFPSHLRDVLPVLLAMLAISTTFAIYNFFLFHIVMENKWSNVFITYVFNTNFAFCVFSLVGLLFYPALALSRKLMVFLTVLLAIGGGLLFGFTDSKSMWVLFFLLEGAIGVFWHQNVRLTLVENAGKSEYARIFGLYTICHLLGNILGGTLFQFLQSNAQVVSVLFVCYGVCVLSLFWYPPAGKGQPEAYRAVKFQKILALMRNRPFVWLVSLAAGFIGETVFNFYAPYLNQVGISAALALLALLVFQVSGIVFKYPTAFLMDKVGLTKTTRWVVFLSVLMSFILAGYTENYPVAVIAVAVLLGGGLSSLTIVGDTAIMKIVPTEGHQEALALSMLVYFMGGLLGNTLVGPAMDYIAPIFFPMITVVFIVLMWVALLPYQKMLAGR